MDVTILGSGGPMPDPERAGPSTLIQAAGQNLLFDSGRATLMRLTATGTGVPMLHAVFLTHLHSDHITDLNDLISTRWVTTFAPSPLVVIGPPGTRQLVDGALAMLGPDIGYRMAHHDDLPYEPPVDVTELAEGTAYESGEVRVTAAPTDHRPVHPSVGFRVEHAGSVVAIAGDTVPCEGLDRICRDADVYVQTVIKRELMENFPIKRFREAAEYHSDTRQAGEVAAANGVRTLVLNHPVPTPLPGSEHQWIADAAEHFDGEILLAHDLLKVHA